MDLSLARLFKTMPGGKIGIITIIISLILALALFLANPNKKTLTNFLRTIGKTLLTSQKNIQDIALDLKNKEIGIGLSIYYLVQILAYSWITLFFVKSIYKFVDSFGMYSGASFLVAGILYWLVYYVAFLVLWGDPSKTGFWDWTLLPVQGWRTFATNVKPIMLNRVPDVILNRTIGNSTNITNITK